MTYVKSSNQSTRDITKIQIMQREIWKLAVWIKKKKN